MTRGPRSRLIQVVPAFAPNVEGVSAYAVRLGDALDTADGPECSMIAGGGSSERTEGAVTIASGEAIGVALESHAGGLVPGDALLLHYVGYGYHSRGVPTDLVSRVERIARSVPGLRLGVMFHEVWAFGPPWRSSFWTHPLQRRLARRLVTLADEVATSIDVYGRLLRGLGARSDLPVIPIPSSVGRPEVQAAWEERPRVLAVFGGRGTRARAWGRSRNALAQVVAALQIESIVDIGERCGAPSSFAGVSVRATGEQPARKVVEELAGSRAGFLSYPPEFLGKSSVMAAYQACGCVPIVAWPGKSQRPLALEGMWAEAKRADLESPSRLRAVAEHARLGYECRSMKLHASTWLRLLFPR